MNDIPTDDTALSKRLSYVLRHRPDSLGLTLGDGGWIEVDTLLARFAASGQPIAREALERVVANSDKQRFALSADGLRIRANQGHSVEVDLQLSPSTPPARLYHGTARRFLDAILREGLRPGQRHHVHLSTDLDTATRVGARHGAPVVLTVDAAAMHAAGHVFFVSDNGVWLTAHVPTDFLLQPST